MDTKQWIKVMQLVFLVLFAKSPGNTDPVTKPNENINFNINHSNLRAYQYDMLLDSWAVADI